MILALDDELAAALRNALAARSLQLDELLTKHDGVDAGLAAEGFDPMSHERVRNGRLRASLSAEAERVIRLDEMTLAGMATARSKHGN